MATLFPVISITVKGNCDLCGQHTWALALRAMCAEYGSNTETHIGAYLVFKYQEWYIEFA